MANNKTENPMLTVAGAFAEFIKLYPLPPHSDISTFMALFLKVAFQAGAIVVGTAYLEGNKEQWAALGDEIADIMETFEDGSAHEAILAALRNATRSGLIQ